MPRRFPTIRRAAAMRRSPRRRIVVFCEGRNTEPSYLVAFNRAFGGGLVDVRPQRGAGVPTTLLKLATEEKRRLQRSKDSFERQDEVWTAFDRDEHEEVEACIQQCRHRHIGVAFSNPCIEQWALIHFQDPVSDAPLTRHQAQAELGKLMPGYAKNGSKVFDFESMKGRYGEAVANAKILLSRRAEEGAPHSAPVTTFHELTERIRALGQTKKES